MAYEEITALLGGWPGFAIEAVTREPGGTSSGAPRPDRSLPAHAVPMTAKSPTSTRPTGPCVIGPSSQRRE